MTENENGFNIHQCDGCVGALTKREQLYGLCSKCEKPVPSVAKNPGKIRKQSKERRSA